MFNRDIHATQQYMRDQVERNADVKLTDAEAQGLLSLIADLRRDIELSNRSMSFVSEACRMAKERLTGQSITSGSEVSSQDESDHPSP